jgi:bifunctional DNA-binding transcriptional regulator/antitoxin component of YhaV-PrlF toxin-antitoxin module
MKELKLARRKLQRAKAGVYYITIPPAWIRSLGLRRGDALQIATDAEQLLLRLIESEGGDGRCSDSMSSSGNGT